MMNAEGLAHIMNDLFGNVVYAGIDTDKHKYPIGLCIMYCITYKLNCKYETQLKRISVLSIMS